jgi:AAA family ATP:ADP antiporter
MMAAVGILLVCIGLIVVIERRSRSTDVTASEEPVAREGAWELLAHDKYLWFIAGMVILLNWVNSSGEYILDRTLLVAAKEAATHGVAAGTFIGSFKADYYVWYNSIGVGLQLLAVSRILRLIGVRRTLLVMPAFALVAYGSAAFLPVLAVMRVVKIGENALQYSVQDTSRHALFLVATRVEKFVGKTSVDTIAVRLGAIVSALMVYAGTHLGWSMRVFAVINVCLSIGWIGFVLLIGREHRRRSADAALSTPLGSAALAPVASGQTP